MVQTADGRTHNPDFLAQASWPQPRVVEPLLGQGHQARCQPSLAAPLQVRQAFPDPATAQLCVACGGGTRGPSAAEAIVEAGYAAVSCAPGGMKAWAARGLPTTAAEQSSL